MKMTFKNNIILDKMGIKLLSNYPIKQFPGISIPNVEFTFKGEFRQEKRDNKYMITTLCFIYNDPQHTNPFEIMPFGIECNVCPVNPLTELYTAFKEQQLVGMEFEDN
jgi:hypothetical protein